MKALVFIKPAEIAPGHSLLRDALLVVPSLIYYPMIFETFLIRQSKLILVVGTVSKYLPNIFIRQKKYQEELPFYVPLKSTYLSSVASEILAIKIINIHILTSTCQLLNQASLPKNGLSRNRHNSLPLVFPRLFVHRTFAETQN